MRSLFRGFSFCLGLPFVIGLLLGEGAPIFAKASVDPLKGGIGWTMTGLDLDVTVEPRHKRLRVTGVAQLRLDIEASHGPTLGVNTRKAVMKWISVEAPKGATVELNARLPQFGKGRFANVRFAKALRKGEQIDITFELMSSDRSTQLAVQRRIAIASWTDGWYPMALPRLDEGEGFTARLISVPGRTTLRLPLGWKSLSDGELVSRVDGEEQSVDVFEVGANGSLSVARSFVASAYEAAEKEVSGRKVRVYLHREREITVDGLANLIGEAMAAQEAKLGPFPFPSYGVAEVPNDIADSWYAASQQTFIVAKSSAFRYEHGNLPLWAHEMCHGWWGNTVSTGGPGSKMCGEALAQLGVLIALEKMEGRAEMIEFLEFSRSGYSPMQCARGYFTLIRVGTDYPLARLGTSGLSANQTHNLADSKGMWVYHMLREHIGDEIFYKTLRSLVTRYAGKTMTLDDVREAFIAAAPEAQLEEFFAQWLDRKGAPIFDVVWTQPSDGHLEIVLSQVQKRGAPFQFDLEVEIVFEDGSARRETVNVEERETTVALGLTGSVEEIRLDPERRLLLWRPAYGTRP